MPDFWSAEHEKHAYLRVNVRIRYIWRSGQVHQPVAWYTGNPKTVEPKSVVLRASQQYGYRLVTFDIVRLGRKPKLPSPDPDPAYGEVLLESDFLTGNPESLPNAAHLFWACGYHLFAVTKPKPPDAAFYNTGRSPIERSNANGSATFDASDLDKAMSGLLG